MTQRENILLSGLELPDDFIISVVPMSHLTLEHIQILRADEMDPTQAIILVTKNDIIKLFSFNMLFASLFEKSYGFSRRREIAFYKKKRYPFSKIIPRYWDTDKDHWYIWTPLDMNPIFTYSKGENASEIIRDYTKLQDEVKMIGFWITDLRINY